MSCELHRALPYLTPTRSLDDTGPLHAFGSKDAPVARAFSDSLNINYMIDEPGAAIFVRERDVATGRHDALHQRALENLRAHTSRRKLRFERLACDVWVAKLDGHHDASLLLLDELWDPPTRVMDPDGELVVALPERSRVMLTGTGTHSGLGALRAALAESAHKALSPELFVRRAQSWEPLAR